MSTSCQLWLWGSQWISEFFASITLNHLRWWGPLYLFIAYSMQSHSYKSSASKGPDCGSPINSKPNSSRRWGACDHHELVIRKILPCLPEDMEEELHTTDAEALWKHMLWKHMLWKCSLIWTDVQGGQKWIKSYSSHCWTFAEGQQHVSLVNFLNFYWFLVLQISGWGLSGYKWHSFKGSDKGWCARSGPCRSLCETLKL